MKNTMSLQEFIFRADVSVSTNKRSRKYFMSGTMLIEEIDIPKDFEEVEPGYLWTRQTKTKEHVLLWNPQNETVFLLVRDLLTTEGSDNA